MGLINYEQLEDGFDASANLWNERFGILFNEINGNLDAANLKNNAITSSKIAPGAVTSEKLAINRSIDDNGWTVNDYGTHQTWSRRITGSPGVLVPANDLYVIPTVKLPVGVARRDAVTLQATLSGTDRVFLFADSSTSSDTSFFFRLSNWYTNAVNLPSYTVDLTLERL